MTRNELEAVLGFLREAEGLKSVERDAWCASGRQESTAEHSWRLALLAALLLPSYPGLDGQRVLTLCLLHDLGERYEGDISAVLRPDPAKKRESERRAMERLTAPLPPQAAAALLVLWEEYEACATPEARLVRALDKAETILQHNQGANPPGFDYAFNLEYGAAYFKGDPTLELLRELLDRDTREKMNKL